MLIASNLGHRSQCSNVRIRRRSRGAVRRQHQPDRGGDRPEHRDRVRSIETGLLVRDAALATGMEQHSMGLIEEGASACSLVLET